MDYEERFAAALKGLRAEGRYRVFMDLQRLRGAFPFALLRETDGRERRITIWCGNDYLGMGQNPDVLDQMKRPKFVAADTMDLWLNIAMKDLLRLIKRIAIR